MFWDQPLLAIDVGSSSVKVCELSRGGKSLLNLGLELFPFSAVEDGVLKDPETVRDVVIEMLKKMKIKVKGRRASIAVGGSGVLIKRALITPDSQSDLHEQAAYEASQVFPYEPEDLYMRFATIGKADESGRVPMVLVGAKRELVEQNIALIHSLGLKTGVVDCGPLTVANMFDFNYPVDGAFTLLANIGASITGVVISFNGEFLYSREIPIGGRDYNNQIMAELSVDFENAENLKLSASMGDQSVSEQINSILADVNERLCAEIQTTLNFFFENEEYPDGMSRSGYGFLVGGAAKTMGLDATLASILQMPVQIANPFQRIDCRKSAYSMEYLINQGSLFGSSVGLALRQYHDHQE